MSPPPLPSSFLLPLLLPLLLLLLPPSHASPSPLPPSLHLSHLLPPDSFPNNTYINRTIFPSNFTFGALTMAMKHEGAVFADGKVESIWDYYARESDVVFDGTAPGMCGDEYNRYEEDINAIVEMGMEAFRFSIAWARIFPNGTGSPNAAAIAHYNTMIDFMLEKGIEPHVTLWAEDHPQYLEEQYGGLLSPLFIDDFVSYANVCFTEFGDRVKYWITLDEPNDWASLAYASSQSPPGRCTPGYTKHGTCSEGNSSTEPYIVGHHALLAHAAVAELYKSQFQADQDGFIGMALWFKWYEPLNTTDADDLAAAQRAQAFFFDWFMEPLKFGKYPDLMVEWLGPRLPSFTEEQSASLQQSLDFIGLNVVTAAYVTNYNESQATDLGYFEDMRISMLAYKDGVPIGEGETEYSVPWCLERIIGYMKARYNDTPIYITEIGWGISYAPSLAENLNDTERIQFLNSYYRSLSDTLTDGGDVRGLFVWSIVDGFEFFLGLTVRFGLFHVDEDMNRYPRLSAFWHKMFLNVNDTSTDFFQQEFALSA